jgi:hypothetical protein
VFAIEPEKYNSILVSTEGQHGELLNIEHLEKAMTRPFRDKKVESQAILRLIKMCFCVRGFGR